MRNHLILTLDFLALRMQKYEIIVRQWVHFSPTEKGIWGLCVMNHVLMMQTRLLDTNSGDLGIFMCNCACTPLSLGAPATYIASIKYILKFAMPL